jgi:thiol:disulfide interchange protein DsbC
MRSSWCGNGARKMAVSRTRTAVTCKKFEQDINAMDNITAYIFCLPIWLPARLKNPKAVWCSPDRLKAGRI